MDLKATPYIPSNKKSMSNLLDTNTMTPEDIESRLSELYNTKLSGNVKEQMEFTSMSLPQDMKDNEPKLSFDGLLEKFNNLSTFHTYDNDFETQTTKFNNLEKRLDNLMVNGQTTEEMQSSWANENPQRRSRTLRRINTKYY
jgi:hypothetical protein